MSPTRECITGENHTGCIKITVRCLISGDVAWGCAGVHEICMEGVIIGGVMFYLQFLHQIGLAHIIGGHGGQHIVVCAARQTTSPEHGHCVEKESERARMPREGPSSPIARPALDAIGRWVAHPRTVTWR